MKLSYIIVILAILFSPFSIVAQKYKAGKENWQNLDLKEDGILGISTEKAYRELLKKKNGEVVVVAVIDGGVQADHQDLKSVMWTNPKEISGNGLDDDNNGYIDDIHGWNFIGNPNGENVQYDNLELVRLIRDVQPKYISVLPSTRLPEKEKKEFQQYQEMVAVYMDKLQKAQVGQLNYNGLKALIDTIENDIGKENPSPADFENYKPKNKSQSQALRIIKGALKDGKTFKEFYTDLKEGYDYYNNQVDYHLNMAYDSRGLVGDDYENSAEHFYGNADVEGPEGTHGTHVAGIIGGDRTNDIGMKGVADNVKIMSIRTVPDGDERDKDVANAIRYAADNGAKVINMSFGKAYVKDKQVVDQAVQYAMSKDVLLVHAAGNDGKDIDKNPNYPNPYYVDSLGINKGEGDAWLTVGATSWDKDDMIASFSNYGKRSVDVFAPGVDIYSAVPKSDYKELSGTSMASPVVAGLAALIRSYYPLFTAPEVKNIIMESVVKVDEKVKVRDEKGSKKVYLSDISKTGGVVNAYEALKLAKKQYKRKK